MKYCSYCGSKDHDTKYCPKTWGGYANRQALYCSYCGSDKHMIKYCPKTWDGQGNRRANPHGDFID